MSRAILILAALIILAGCRSEPLKVTKAKQAARTRAALLINGLKTGMAHLDLVAEYKEKLISLGKYAVSEILAVAVNPTEARAVRMHLLDITLKIEKPLEKREQKAVPFLIHMLDDPDELIRDKARFVLMNVTGKNMHFLTAPDSGPVHNRGVAAWKNWWFENRYDYAWGKGEGYYPSAWDAVPAVE